MVYPFVSVIITAYRRKEFLKEALKSALDQDLDRKQYEIIVTKDFVDEEVDRLIVENGLVELRHEGVPIGRMLADAVAVCKGEVIAFLDDDDMWSKERLSRINDIFQQNTELKFYHNGQIFVDAAGKEIETLPGWNPVLPMEHIGELMFASGRMSHCDSFKLVNLNISFNKSSMAIRKQVLEENLFTLKQLVAAADDFLFLSALNSRGEMLADNRKLTKYRFHTGNVSGKVPVGTFNKTWKRRQSIAYSTLIKGFGGSNNLTLERTLEYYSNYFREIDMLTSSERNDDSTFAIVAKQFRFSLGYLMCRQTGTILARGKPGLGYNLRLSAICLVYLLSHRSGRWLYSKLYVKRELA